MRWLAKMLMKKGQALLKHIAGNEVVTKGQIAGQEKTKTCTAGHEGLALCNWPKGEVASKLHTALCKTLCRMLQLIACVARENL